MTLLIVTLLSVIGGAICCFAGYKIFRVALCLMGGCLGAYAGMMLYNVLSGTEIGFMHMQYSELITVLVCAVTFAALAFGFYMKAVVAVVTLICGWYFYTDSRTAGIRLPWTSPVVTILVALVFGLVIGFAVYFLQKWAIIIATSFIGAKIITSVLVPYLLALVSGHQGEIVLKMLTGELAGNAEVVVSLASVLLLTGAGIAVQMSGKK
ncbi:hypothetical protein SAMN02910456_01925 [Ruminococcaceae bacterium YRB3002]|nr:hypothetical protein SAMN02910456_01925 [Ruminococcaceae bacterium YRB3002]